MVETKRRFERVLNKLGFTKTNTGKEIQYEKILNGKVVATTALIKGRGDIAVGTMNNIIKLQLFTNKKDYLEYRQCTKSRAEYENNLINSGVI